MKRPLITGTIFIVWLGAIIAVYFVYHKPFSGEQFVRFVTAGFQCLVPALIVSIAGGMGRRILPFIDERYGERIILYCAAGLGVLGIAVLLVGSTAGVNFRIMGGMLLLLGALFYKDIVGWWRDCFGLVKSMRFRLSKLEAVIGLFFILVLASNLFLALAPPIKFDALVYHLSLPKYYIEYGKVVYLPFSPFWGMPQLGEMLYTLAMAVAGAEAATVLGVYCGVLAMAGIGLLVSRRYGGKAGIFTIAIVLSGATAAISLSWGYVDWLCLLFGWAFLAAINYWGESGREGYLILAGGCAGFALGTKYSAGVLIIGGLAIVVLRGLSNRRFDLRGALVFGGAATAAAAPWLIKNLLATGNPAYPFFYAAGGMDALTLANTQGQPRWEAWQDIFTIPFKFSLVGSEGDAAGFRAAVGPFMLIFGAFAWLGWSEKTAEEKRYIQNAAIVAATGFLLWGVMSRFYGYLTQTRLYFAIFPALYYLAAAGFQGIQRLAFPHVRIAFISKAIVVAVLGTTMIEVTTAVVQKNPAAYVFSTESEEAYLDKNLGWYSPAMGVVSGMGKGEKALMLWEGRSFYCLPKCAPDEMLSTWARDYARYHDFGQIVEAWRGQGYTHVLYYRAGADFIRADPASYTYPGEYFDELDKFLGGLTPVRDFGEAYSLYKIGAP